MSIQAASSLSSLAQSSSVAKTAQEKEQSAISDFQDYLNKPMAEKMLDAWLKAHGISKEQYAAMSPEQKQAISREIAKEIEDKTKQKAEEKAASSTV